MPSLTSTAAGEAYWGYAAGTGTSTGGSTGGFTFSSPGTFGATVGLNASLAAGTTYAPVATQTTISFSETGGIIAQASAASGGSYINNSTLTQAGNFNVQAATSGSVAGVLQANAAGTGDILDLLNGAGTKMATVSSAGLLALTPASISTTASAASIAATNNPSAGGTQTGLNVAITNSPTSVSNTAVGGSISVSDSSTVSTSGGNVLQGLKIAVSDTAVSTQRGGSQGLFVDLSGTTNTSVLGASRPTAILVKTPNVTTQSGYISYAMDLQNASGTSLFKVDNSGAVNIAGQTLPSATAGANALTVTAGNGSGNAGSGGYGANITGGNGTAGSPGAGGTAGYGLTATGGTGGAGSTTFAGAAGGLNKLQGGVGGASGTGNAGAGGDIQLIGGNGGNTTSTGNNGAGGNILLQGGSPGTGGSGTSVAGVVTVKNLTDSTTAFRVQNAAGTSTPFSVNTSTTTGTTTAAVTAIAAGYVGMTIQGVASQTADLMQLQDSTGAVVKRMDAAGNTYQLGNLATAFGGLGTFSNLAAFSDQINNWTLTTITAAANDATSNPAPDGLTSADKLTATGANATAQYNCIAAGCLTNNGTYTFSIWVKTNSTTQPIQLRIDATGSTPTTGTAASFTATTTWQRFSVTQVETGTPTALKPTLVIVNNGGVVVAWGGQLNAGSTVQPYMRTGSSSSATNGHGLVVNGSSLFDSTGSSDIALKVEGDGASSQDLLEVAGAKFKVTYTGSTTVAVGTNLGGGSDPGLTVSTAAAGSGAGGDALTVNAGAGGAGSGSSGSTGGAGAVITGGAGGAVTSATTDTGGTGGAVSLTAGAGGALTTATSGTNAGGTGGGVTIQAGAGGASAATGATNSAGAGGGITLIAGSGGAGTTSNNNSNGGTVLLQGGAAGTTGTGAAGTAGGVTVKNLGDSTAAFQVQNTASTNVFTVDTTNKIDTTLTLNTGTLAGNRLFTDSFESNSFAEWDQGVTGVAAAIDSTIKHNGNYSAKFQMASSNSYYWAHMTSTTGNIYVRGYVYISGLSGSGGTFVNLFGVNPAAGMTKGYDAEVQRSDGKLYIYDGGGLTNVATSGTITQNAWHKVEFRTTTSSGGTLQAWLDGTQVLNTTTGGALVGGFLQAIVGDDNAAPAGNTFYIDDLSIDATPTTTADDGGLNVQDGLHVGGSSSLGQTFVQAHSDSTVAFQVQNAAGSGLLAVDTVNSQVLLGKAGASGIDGKLLFNDAAGAHTVTLQAPASDPASSFAMTLPTAVGANGDCLKQSGTGATIALAFSACGGGGSTLQTAYTASTGGTTAELVVPDTTRKGIDIQDRDTGSGGTIGASESLLAVRASAANGSLGASVLNVEAGGNVGINMASTSTGPTLLYDLTFGSAANRTIGVDIASTAHSITLHGGNTSTSGNFGGDASLQGGSDSGNSTPATVIARGSQPTPVGFTGGNVELQGGKTGAFIRVAGAVGASGVTDPAGILLQTSAQSGGSSNTAGVVVQNLTNYAFGFDVQNASGNSIFSVDTN
ncbi:MAG TPA: hypothetical protein VHQ86_05955, partial [Candidatus Saccharimonadia bacterium]|nr:hypothetical protein [Candidatus Saccharimonadia bacterium]